MSPNVSSNIHASSSSSAAPHPPEISYQQLNTESPSQQLHPQVQTRSKENSRPHRNLDVHVLSGIIVTAKKWKQPDAHESEQVNTCPPTCRHVTRPEQERGALMPRPRGDPEPTTLREGTRHRRPPGVRVHACDMSRTGSSMHGERLRGPREGKGVGGLRADG